MYYLVLFKRNIKVSYLKNKNLINSAEREKKINFSENIIFHDYPLADMFVSIVVCARNEEKNMRELLESLCKQEYSLDQFEAIIVNDGSTDNTSEILKEYADKYNFIKYFDVTNRSEVKSPKKNAISQAITIAKGEIILLTDADCKPTSNWIQSHVSMYKEYPSADMVVGLSKTNLYAYTKPSICQQFEYIDFLVLMFAAQSAIQSGCPMSCSGQNLSYKKNSFNEVGGFMGIDHYISGDDVLLLQKFVKNKKTIKFASFSNAFTITNPINSWLEFFNQRSRWISNSKAMFSMNLTFFFYLLASFFCLGLMPFLFIFLYIILILFSISFITKAMNLYTASSISNSSSKQCYQSNNHDSLLRKGEINFIKILKWSIINPFYIIIATFLGICSIFVWKRD